MTLFNRLSRLFGGHTIILAAPARGKAPAGHGDVPRENVMMIRSAQLTPRQHDWDESDALIAALVEDCAQHLNNRLEEINETR